LARETITGLTTHARSPFMPLHRERKREGIDPLLLERARHSFNHGLMIEGGIRIRRNVRRFRWIDARLAMHKIEFFRQIVVRRELTITDRPRGRNTVSMFQVFEVPLAKAKHRASIQ